MFNTFCVPGAQVMLTTDTIGIVITLYVVGLQDQNSQGWIEKDGDKKVIQCAYMTYIL